MATHELAAGPDTVHWGFYDASLKPVMTVASGDILKVKTESGKYDVLVEAGARPSEANRKIFDKHTPDLGVHILTGPVAVDGAVPGDVLEVRIRDVRPRYDWGTTTFRPLAGGLPEVFPFRRVEIIEIDREKEIGRFGPGIELPLCPFFGNFGVAPPTQMGRVASTFPGVWGGNMDNKELVSGTTIYFPVFAPGALFSVGDGHGCQGDGEVCGTALETGLSGAFELVLRKDMSLELPRAETETHHILMGFDPILDNAVKMALRQTIAFLREKKGLSPEQAYMFCSLAVDLRVTQIVNLIKGVHAMVPKSLLSF